MIILKLADIEVPNNECCEFIISLLSLGQLYYPLIYNSTVIISFLINPINFFHEINGINQKRKVYFSLLVDGMNE